MKAPTAEQLKILDEKKSCVVVARPGSGKTFTLSYKIRDILSELPDYQGVIAISYTNKASEDLRDRVLNLGIQKKASFFGTIDKFCLTEIVIPFMRHKYGLPAAEIKILKADQSDLLKELSPGGIDQITWPLIEKLYVSGEVILELAGRVALQLLKENKVLRDYMKARYSHVIIDEYQDSGREQHCIFMELFNIGLTAVAVGDLDQSIYAFAGKSSDYLYELTQRSDFGKYPLTVNHRCHPSIASYSLKLINSAFVLTNSSDDIRVYCKTVQGYHPQIAEFIEKSIPGLHSKFPETKLSGIAILCRSNVSAKMMRDSITKYKVQYREESPLDFLSSPWAIFFSECLYCILDTAANVNELFQKYLDGDFFKAAHKKSLAKLIDLKQKTDESNLILLKDAADVFKEAAEILVPNSEKNDSERALFEVLGSNVYLQSYFPQKDDHVQMMTLHKSKGLEFDVVFHLDLYQWTIPSYDAVKGNQKEMIQSVNLHYVGITRAKEASILITSTHKFDTKMNIAKAAKISEFLTRTDLMNIRKNI